MTPTPHLPKEDLLGRWEFFGHIYKDEEIDPIDQSLSMELEFKDSKALWTVTKRSGLEGFCKKLSLFELIRQDWSELPILYQRVVWLHPENHMECSNDPEMKFGKETYAPIQIQKEELRLVAPLGEETIIFRFKKRVKSKANTTKMGW